MVLQLHHPQKLTHCIIAGDSNISNQSCLSYNRRLDVLPDVRELLTRDRSTVALLCYRTLPATCRRVTILQCRLKVAGGPGPHFHMGPFTIFIPSSPYLSSAIPTTANFIASRV